MPSKVEVDKLSRLTAVLAVTPAAFLCLVYIPSLSSAYRIDDLAWLSLRNTLAAGHGLLWALFSPQAQGTIRPLGERIWFLLASSLFGLNPIPFHMLALSVQVGSVFLLVSLGQRMLGSPMAAAVAASLWVINDALVEPLVWPSAFNEILYTFWFLAAFYAFLRWIDTRSALWLGLHLAAVVLGFATLELMVCFPAIAAVYVVLFARQRWKAVIPSTLLAVGFVIAHLFAVSIPKDGPYRLTFGSALVRNLFRYWTGVVGPEEYERIHPISPTLALLGTALISAAVIFWLLATMRRRQWLCLFSILWFVIGLVPVLPLNGHFTPYYTFLPLIGPAWLAGDAVVRLRSWPGKSLAFTCLALYTACQISSTIAVRDWYADQSLNVEKREVQLFNAVRVIRRQQPDGPVFLDRLDSEQFWWGLCYGELIRNGFTDLHVLPDMSKHGIAIPPPEWCLDRNFQLSTSVTERLLRDGRGMVYDITALAPLSR